MQKIFSPQNLLVLLVCFGATNSGFMAPGIMAVAQEDVASSQAVQESDGPENHSNERSQLSADQLFAADHVVQISIELSDDDWDEIRIQSRDFASSLTKRPAESPFTWVKGNITIDGVKIEDVGIRKKGFIGSLNSERPSLKIKFAKYVEQDPVDGFTHMTLNNNNQDPGRVLQYISYKLFTESGTRSPRCNFASVTVNGDDLGVYSHVESIREPMLERAFGDGTGPHFEGTVADFFPGWIKKFEKKNDAAKYRHLREVSELLEPDELDFDALADVVDVDAFINYWAMESLIGFWDSYCSNQNNFHIYKNPENDKFYFIPWGTDSSLAKTTPLPPYRIRPRSVHAKAILPNKLYRVPEIQEKYLATLNSFLDEHWQEDKLLAELDNVEAMLDEYLLENNRRRFGRSMKKYRDFIKTRRAEIEKELADGPPELKSRERLPIYFGVSGTIKMTFSANWYDDTPTDTDDLGEVQIKLLDGDKEVELENDATVYSETSKWPNPGGEQPATVVVVVTRKADGKRLTIATTMPPENFKPSDGESVEVGGVLIEAANFGEMKWLGGNAVIEQASMNEGDPVKGTIELKITEMRGGNPIDEPGKTGW